MEKKGKIENDCIERILKCNAWFLLNSDLCVGMIILFYHDDRNYLPPFARFAGSTPKKCDIAPLRLVFLKLSTDALLDCQFDNK